MFSVLLQLEALRLVPFEGHLNRCMSRCKAWRALKKALASCTHSEIAGMLASGKIEAKLHLDILKRLLLYACFTEKPSLVILYDYRLTLLY